MKLEYMSEKVELQCTDLKSAQKLFGGDRQMSGKLMSRINALKSADTIKDIIVQPQFRFHKLKNKDSKNLDGYFAIDVKSIREPWRIIFRPLDDDGQLFDSCKIDEIAISVRIVEITEVSNHYE